MKISIIGRGTVGCSSVAFYLKNTNWDIEWIYDPNIDPAPVGEGTTLVVPVDMRESMNISYDDLRSMKGTVKTGIYKENWGLTGIPYVHNFPLGEVGIHFTAADYQKHIFETLTNNERVTVVESNYNNPDDIDSDYILDCTGTPTLSDEYIIPEHICVNAAFVTQCYWDMPKFNYTLTIARPYGWVFGIPLQDRCAIGYVYNKDITNLEEVKKDVENIFDQYKLTPSERQRNIEFNNYYRKQNFYNRVAYNGNRSFFLEPLEATSTGIAAHITKLSMLVWNKKVLQTDANNAYTQELNDVESMICLHYMCGSTFKNEFWDHAENIAYKKIKKEISANTKFADALKITLSQNKVDFSNPNLFPNVGTWNVNSFQMNIDGLGIRDTLLSMFQNKIG